MLRDLPFDAIEFVAYEQLKKSWVKYKGSDIRPHESAVIGKNLPVLLRLTHVAAAASVTCQQPVECRSRSCCCWTGAVKGSEPRRACASFTYMRHVQDMHEACLYTMTASGQCLLRIARLLLLHASSSCMGCGYGTDLSLHGCHAALPTCRPDGHTILTGLQATLTLGLKYANILIITIIYKNII